jgi:hypothetical protein
MHYLSLTWFGADGKDGSKERGSRIEVRETGKIKDEG